MWDPDVIINRDTESPEEIPPASTEFQKAASGTEPDPPSPAEDEPTGLVSNSPEPLLATEPDEPPATEGSSERKDSVEPLAIANPVFADQVGTEKGGAESDETELKEVPKEVIKVEKKEDEVVMKEEVIEKA